MGEWSRSIGEKGEKLTKFLFEEILNINSLEENTSISCLNSEKHIKSKNPRKTHGIDGLYHYENPLEDELLEIVLISSKYTLKYPPNPKSKFKEHLKDLAEAIECFKLSKENSEINQRYSSVSKTVWTGILVWLSNDDEKDSDIISKVSNSLIDGDLEFDKIILLDNKRVDFLYETLYKTKILNPSVKIVYHNTSLNQGSINELSYGDKFPIDYLYSDIIHLRVEKDNEITFLIFINDNFDKLNFSQILAFAKTYDFLNAIDNTIINYLDYDSLKHEKMVKSVLTDYQSFKLDSNLKIMKFPNDFRL
jgi:hypothetical protein